jgi:hypothetical protein
LPSKWSRLPDSAETASDIVLVLWFDDCSKIGNIGNIVESQRFSRQHFGNKKSNKKLHYRYRMASEKVLVWTKSQSTARLRN